MILVIFIRITVVTDIYSLCPCNANVKPTCINISFDRAAGHGNGNAAFHNAAGSVNAAIDHTIGDIDRSIAFDRCPRLTAAGVDSAVHGSAVNVDGRIALGHAVIAAAHDAALALAIRTVGNSTAVDIDGTVALDHTAPAGAADNGAGHVNRSGINIDGAVAVDCSAAAADQGIDIDVNITVRPPVRPDIHSRAAVNFRVRSAIRTADDIRVTGRLKSKETGNKVGRDTAVNRSGASSRQRIIDLPACLCIIDLNQIDCQGIFRNHSILIGSSRSGIDFRNV